MKYIGSKRKFAKEILSIILHRRKPNQWYVEPFVGGFNVIGNVKGNRIANDVDYYLIELFKAIQGGWIPPDNISEHEYNEIKNNKDKYPSYLVGFVGFGCSFGSKWFDTYARSFNSNGKSRNYAGEVKRDLLKQARNIQNVIIHNRNYWEIDIPPNSIIYCDQPYADVLGYNIGNFDHNLFWDWCRKKIKEGHSVFVSEYKAPDDFISIWQKETKILIYSKRGTNYKKAIEKLFVYKDVKIVTDIMLLFT